MQTQINLAAIEALGPQVPFPLRAVTTGQDLVGFGPMMALIAAGALLPAFAAAEAVSRLGLRLRPLIYALAGVCGLWAAFTVMGFFTPMPTLVAAVRGAWGLAAVCATGAIGGLVFARLTRRA